MTKEEIVKKFTATPPIKLGTMSRKEIMSCLQTMLGDTKLYLENKSKMDLVYLTIDLCKSSNNKGVRQCQKQMN